MMDNVRIFLELAEHLELAHPFLYVEIARTRTTDCMAWICTHNRESNPVRKVIASGQGATFDDACKDALEGYAAANS